MNSLAGVLPAESQVVGDGEGDPIHAQKLLLQVQDSPAFPLGKTFILTRTGLRHSTRRMNDGRTIIGTEPTTCDILLNADDPEVGKMHCVIEFYAANECFTVKDLGEGNGTFMKIMDSQTLHNGDVLSFGASHAGVQIQSQGSASTLTLRFFEGPRANEILSFGSNDEYVKIGRVPDCTIVIDDNNLSRYQCMIQHQRGKGWVIIDGDGGRTSANGTWLYLDRDFRITDGMLIKVGKTLFKATLIEEERRPS